MDNLFVRGVSFDWRKVDRDSYIRDIDAFQGLKIFLSETQSHSSLVKTVVANLPCWRQLPLLMALIRKVVRRTIHFLRTTHIPNYAMPLPFQKATEKRSGAISFVPKAFIMWLHKKKNMPMKRILPQCIMPNHMARAFYT